MGRNMGQTENAINCLVLLMQRAAMKKCGLLDQHATTAPASVTTNPGFRVQQVNLSNDAALYLSKDVFFFYKRHDPSRTNSHTYFILTSCCLDTPGVMADGVYVLSPDCPESC